MIVVIDNQEIEVTEKQYQDIQDKGVEKFAVINGELAEKVETNVKIENTYTR